MTADTGPDAFIRDKSRWASLTLGCVLAGGLSRRMGGGEKSLMPLCGAPMIARTVERLRPQVGGMIVSANGDPARFAEFGLPVVADAVPGHAGPLAGVLAAMGWARAHSPKARWVVTVAADTPFYPDDLVVRLVGAAGHHETMIAVARSGDKAHPVFGLWPVALADDLEAALDAGERKVMGWVRRNPHVEVIFRGPVIDDIEIDPFFNVNTPEDMETAEAVAAELSGEMPA